MRKILATVAAIMLSGAIAYAANLPYLVGPNFSEPSQILANFNTLIQSINNGTSGVIAAYVSPTASTATGTQQVLASVTIPTGTLVTAGQSLRATCAGTKNTNADSAIVGIQFGTQQVSSNSWTSSGGGWRMDALITISTPATATVYVANGFNGTNVVTPTSGYNTTDSFGTGQPIKCLATTAGTLNDLTLEDFIVEQVK